MRARFRPPSIKQFSVVTATLIFVLWIASTQFGFRWQLSDRNSIRIRNGIASFERMIGRDDQIAYSQSLHGKTNSISLHRHSSGSLLSQFTRPQCGDFMYCVCGGNMPMWRTFNLPFWLPFIAAATPAALISLRDRRRAPGHCRKCNYDLTANESGRCPECGTNVSQNTLEPPNPTPARSIFLAKWMMIIGLIFGASINCAFECDKWVSRPPDPGIMPIPGRLDFEAILGLPDPGYLFQVTPEMLTEWPKLRPFCDTVMRRVRAAVATAKIAFVSMTLPPVLGRGWPFETTAPTYYVFISDKTSTTFETLLLDSNGESPVRRSGWILNTGAFATFFGTFILLVRAAYRKIRHSPQRRSPAAPPISEPAACLTAT